MLATEEPIQIESLLGSYAGAVGFGQFIPSSYRVFSVDFDNDGFRDLVGSIDDAMGSVAHYLMQHDWNENLDLALVARLDKKNSAFWNSNELAFLDTSKELASRGVSGIPKSWIDQNHPISLLKLQGLEDEQIWAVTKNFKVITRYNRSPLYAMAVSQLALEFEALLGI